MSVSVEELEPPPYYATCCAACAADPRSWRHGEANCLCPLDAKRDVRFDCPGCDMRPVAKFGWQPPSHELCCPVSVHEDALDFLAGNARSPDPLLVGLERLHRNAAENAAILEDPWSPFARHLRAVADEVNYLTAGAVGDD